MTVFQSEYSNLINRLRAVRRKETISIFLANALKTIAYACIVIVAFSLLEMLAKGDVTFRTVIALIILLLTLGLAAYYVGPIVLKIFGIRPLPNEEDIALRIGEHYPDLQDKLCNSIQLVSNNNSLKGTSKDLAFAAFQQTSTLADKKDFDVIIDKNNIKKSLLIFLSIMAITAISMGVFQSSLGSAMYRILHFNQSFLPPAPFSLTLEPTNMQVLRGKPVTILIKAKGEYPEKITLFVKEEKQENYDQYTLTPDSTGTYRYEVLSLKNSITFNAEANWLSSVVKTEEGTITVTDRPTIKSFTGRLTYPSYTRLTAKSFDEQTADISALKGSVVSLQVIANKELSSARIIFEETPSIPDSNQKASNPKTDTMKLPMNVDGNKAYGSFAVRKNGAYYVIITDKNGQQSIDPIKYNVIALNDDYPSIALLFPTMDVQVTEEAKMPIKVAITDDYGFSTLKLHYKLIQSKYTSPDAKYKTISIPILSKDNTAEVPYLWDLASIGMSPEDVYEFYLEIFDNDVVTGPKSSRTQTLMVRLPSLEEVLNEADKAQEQIQKDLQKVLDKAEDVKKDMDELNKEMLKNQDKQIDWKEKKKAQDIADKQKQLQEKMQEVQKNIEDMSKKLEQNNAISPETLQKFQELQKLMQEVNSPELRRMQEKMQQAMNQLSEAQVQKAMQEIKFDEESFRKSIERTLKLLKRMQAEQKTDALTKLAEKIQERQEELQKKMDNANSSNEQKRDALAKEQKNLADDLKKMANELDDLQKLMKEIGDDMPQQELQQAENDLDKNQTSSDMQDAEQQMNKGNFNQAKKSQNNAQKRLQKFAQDMKKVKQEMENRTRKEAERKMKKAINDMLQLSEKQEDLKEKTNKADYNSLQIPKLAQEQSDILQSMVNVANALMALSEKSMAVTPEMGEQIGNSMQQMQNSIKDLADMQTGQASQEQQNAMSSMNNAIKQMQNMLSQMQQQGNGSCNNPGGMGQGQSSNGNNGMGFGQKLQQLAAQQQAINQAMQQMGSNGGKLSPEQQAKMGRLSNEQGNAAKSMQELAEDQKKYPGDQAKQALGSLEKIAQEMKEVVSDMKRGSVTPETMKKQERILSRLLDATKSIHDRDYEVKRESQTGKQFDRQSPSALDLPSKANKSKEMEEFLRSLQQGYTKDYENLIRKYFESFQNRKN